MDSESQQIPSLVPGVDVYSLPLDTTEGFVLSCIDGSLSVEDISFMSGISVGQLARILDRLVELGAVRWSEPTQQPPSGPEEHQSEVRDTRGRRESSKRPAAPPRGGAVGSGEKTPSSPQNRMSFLSSRRPGANRFAKAGARLSFGEELVPEHEVDLDPERKKKIYETYSRMEEQNYYELLGVSQNASRQLVRSAYFELSRTFHPDSVFGKRLGHYKPKMEAVFKRMTEAYDVLSRSQKRKEYDEYLATTVRTRRLTAALQTDARELERARESLLTARSASQTAPASTPPASDPAPADKRKAIMPPPAEKKPDELPAGSLKPPRVPTERRIRMQNVLRKRLDAVAGGPPVPGRSPLPTVPPPSGYPHTEYAEESSDKQKEERRSNAIRGLFRSLKEASEASSGGANKLEQYLQQARESEQAGDLLAAANSLRLALSADPDNEELKAYHERINSTLTKSLNREYEKQAKYEEKLGKWEAAAASWCKVSEGRPEDAEPPRRTAEALLKAGGDPRRAQKFAQKAVELEPGNADNLVLLARVFVAADMKLNAKRELEKAAKLDPSNEMVKNLLKEVR